ncbi:MAG: hypothetical protein IJ137_01615, partial [Eubacterium sp.]|nr:hypothetical protein [Eubacterium sp.]
DGSELSPLVEEGVTIETDVQSKDIEKVIGEIKKGKTVKQITAKSRMEEGLVDQICRMYLTHPGVDADGIMTKLGF